MADQNIKDNSFGIVLSGGTETEWGTEPISIEDIQGVGMALGQLSKYFFDFFDSRLEF